MVHPALWLLAGLTLPKVYEKLSPETKRNWKKTYDFHHGEAGVLMFLGGAVSKNLGLAAFGAGLVMDDWGDKHLWFKKKFDNDDEEDKSNWFKKAPTGDSKKNN